MKKQGLIKSTVILTATSLICRSVGMLSIVYLSNRIGAEGVGLYQLIMSIYMMAIIFASSGFSVAVSKIVAEEVAAGKEEHINKIMRNICGLSMLISILVGSLLFKYATIISIFFVKDMRGVFALKILAISIPFITLSSCFKGYFYAMKAAIKPASSDVIEQLIKFTILIAIVSKWAPRGLEYACAAGAVSITIGEIFSFTYMLWLYKRDRKRQPPRNREIIKMKGGCRRILEIVLPIAAAAYIGSMLMTGENILIPIGLKKFGVSAKSSMEAYGILKGMVMPVLFFPAAFLTAFATTLIPEIARVNGRHNQLRVNYTIERVLQCTFLLSILVVSIFVFFHYEIGMVLYKQKLVGDMLAILAFIVPFMYMEMVVDSILKGLGQQVSSLKYSILDSVFRVTTVYLLIPIRGMVAFIGIMVVSNILTSSLNFNRLLQVTKIKVDVRRWVIYPCLSAVASGLVVKAILKYSISYDNLIVVEILVGVPLLVSMYVLCLFLLESITIREIRGIRKRLVG